MPKKKVRHILGLSGGKDSTALAVYLTQHKKMKDIEYFFCDTGCELPETYEFLERLKARLGISITYLRSQFSFDELLQNQFNGFLPSVRSRWCTVKLKIEPLEKFVGKDDAISYIGIRADEDREGYISEKSNINPVFPFKENGLRKEDILDLLEDSGIGMPKYYEWRSRSGCYFCFFQRKYEWIMLAEKHPDLFAKALKYETEHQDGRKYYWNEDEPLAKLIKRKQQIIAEHKKMIEREPKTQPKRSLITVFETFLFEDEDSYKCSLCHR